MLHLATLLTLSLLPLTALCTHTHAHAYDHTTTTHVTQQDTSPPQVNITALTYTPSEFNAATLQCWTLSDSLLTPYPTTGHSSFLAHVTNTTLVTLPPNASEGWHKPPYPMLFILLSGSARVNLPGGRGVLSLTAGQGLKSMVVAADTRGGGHMTAYGPEGAVALQVPFKEVPGYEVRHRGACDGVDYEGLDVEGATVGSGSGGSKGAKVGGIADEVDEAVWLREQELRLAYE